MNEALVEYIKEDIERAFFKNDPIKIQKETLFLFDRVIHFLLSHGKYRLKGITFEKNEIAFDENYLMSKENKLQMYRMLSAIAKHKHFINDSTFGKLRIDIERWYLELGGEAIYFDYEKNYLVTPQKAADSLSVSLELFNDFTKQGLEQVKVRRRYKIPKHAIVLWREPAYAIRMQMLVQKQNARTETIDKRLIKVREQIEKLQNKHEVLSARDALQKYKIHDLNTYDNPYELRRWLDFEHEEIELMGGSRHV